MLLSVTTCDDPERLLRSDAPRQEVAAVLDNIYCFSIVIHVCSASASARLEREKLLDACAWIGRNGISCLVDIAFLDEVEDVLPRVNKPSSIIIVGTYCCAGDMKIPTY